MAVPITVLFAEDHSVVGESLAAHLDAQPGLRVIGTAADGAEALVHKLKPDVAVLDIGMPRQDGVDAARLICRHAPATRVVALSMHSDREHILRALQAGAMA